MARSSIFVAAHLHNPNKEINKINRFTEEKKTVALFDSNLKEKKIICKRNGWESVLLFQSFNLHVLMFIKTKVSCANYVFSCFFSSLLNFRRSAGCRLHIPLWCLYSHLFFIHLKCVDVVLSTQIVQSFCKCMFRTILLIEHLSIRAFRHLCCTKIARKHHLIASLIFMTFHFATASLQLC